MKRQVLHYASFPIAIVIIVILLHNLGLLGNKEVFGYNYTYKYAQIKLMNQKLIEGEISHWAQDPKTDVIRIKFKNGDKYLSHSSNVILYNR